MTMRDDVKTRKTEVFYTAETRSVSTKEDCDHQHEVTQSTSNEISRISSYVLIYLWHQVDKYSCVKVKYRIETHVTWSI